MLELHCHLDGSLPIGLVRELARNQGVDIPQGKALEKALRVNQDNRSLGEYLEKFDLPLRLLQDTDSLRMAAKEVAGQAADEGLKYIEIRYAPLLHTQHGLDCISIIEAVALGLHDAKDAYGITASSILCAMRHMDLEENMEMVKAGQQLLGHGVCAIDLAGDEAAWPTSEHRDIFSYAKKENIPFTIHAGECGSPANVAEAIDMGAWRIGHGVAAYKDGAVLQKCVQSGIPLELCPVSNIHTRAVDGWDSFPILQMLEAGVRATVNTDNRTVSNTSLANEFQMLEQHLGMEDEQRRQLLRNAVYAAFADDSMKDMLLKAII